MVPRMWIRPMVQYVRSSKFLKLDGLDKSTSGEPFAIKNSKLDEPKLQLHRRCEGIEIERDSPLLASPQGGVAASSRRFRVATELDAAGVVYILFSSENHPGFAISGGFAIFLDRSATPPCGDARRGLSR